ncbi:hypothetical protein [Streptomyces sp.]|uniref:hypothetical protein n=1 Tax=Streptomyces sp. TaxID=1931 RepID=UPI002F934242
MSDFEATANEISRALEQSARARRCVSAAGRDLLAAAVSIDHDWSLRFSSEDKLIDAVAGMSDDDLEAAALLVRYLDEAIGTNLIRRDTARRTEGGEPR